MVAVARQDGLRGRSGGTNQVPAMSIPARVRGGHAASALAALRSALIRLADGQGFATASGAAEPLHWVVLGPPGVGKGTYATRVAAAFGVPHIATGDLIRAEIASGSRLGAEVRLASAMATS